MTNKLETKILSLYNEGKKNREIARQLSIHHNTVAYWLNKHDIKSHGLGLPIDMVDEKNARCRKCTLVKPVDEFQFGRRGQKYEYRFSFCNECRKKQSYLNLNKDVDRFLADRFNRMKRRAKENDITFSITKDEFIKQYHKQNGLCFYTDEILVCEVGKNLNRNSLSIDKIVPGRGYIYGNVVFTTHRINTCKCDLSLEEIRRWMPNWFERIHLFLGEKMDNGQHRQIIIKKLSTINGCSALEHELDATLSMEKEDGSQLIMITDPDDMLQTAAKYHVDGVYELDGSKYGFYSKNMWIWPSGMTIKILPTTISKVELLQMIDKEGSSSFSRNIRVYTHNTPTLIKCCISDRKTSINAQDPDKIFSQDAADQFYIKSLMTDPRIGELLIRAEVKKYYDLDFSPGNETSVPRFCFLCK